LPVHDLSTLLDATSNILQALVVVGLGWLLRSVHIVLVKLGTIEYRLELTEKRLEILEEEER